MAAKNKRPNDILDDLFSQPTDETSPQDILDDLIYRERESDHLELPARQKDSTGRSPGKRKRKRRRLSKKKATHYLPTLLLDDLGEARNKLFELLPAELKSKASKSAIVNHALQLILDEFTDKGSKSTLVKKILDDKAGK